jgi:cell division protein ZapE
MRSARHAVREAYRESLQRHRYRADAAQLHAVARLDALRIRLHERENRSWLTRIGDALRGRPRDTSPRGVYLWGGVGRGKTFLMDLFHAHAGVPARREHFHRYMQDVHARLGALRSQADPLELVAAAMARECRVLCLDELYVSDIGDAMILAGLFTGLTAAGVPLVCTSNSPPHELYREGLQRARFLPAIALLKQSTEVIHVDSGNDYRLRQLEKAPLYFAANDPGTGQQLAGRFESIAGESGCAAHEITVEGRQLRVRRSTGDVIWFDFDELCAGPRSQLDYNEIARDFHTVLVSGVPRFDATRDNEARRFIALVDELYDRNVKLVLSAYAPVAELYGGERLRLEFARTESRLIEMQSHAYLARPHKP